MYAGCGYWIYISSYDGGKWTLIDSSLLGQEIFNLTADGSNIIAGTRSGPYLSTDNGVNWTDMSSGLHELYTKILFVKDSVIYTATQSDGIEIYKSTNSGKNWNVIDLGFSQTIIYCLAEADSTVFVGTGPGLYKCTYSGSAWTAEKVNTTSSAINCIAIDGNIILAGTLSEGVFLSTDKGESWSEINNGLTNLNITHLAIEGTNFIAATKQDGMFRSSDFGNSWTAINSGLLPYPIGISCMDISGSKIVISKSDGVYLSTNLGDSWNKIRSSGVVAITILGSNIFVAIGEVYLSTNNGEYWKDVSSGLIENNVSSIYLNDTYIFAGTHGNGTYSAELSKFNLTDVTEPITDNKDICIYPNPASNKITITFPEITKYNSISIFNSLGMEVKRIASSEIIGNSAINISTNDLPIGMYYCTLTNEDSRITKSFYSF